MLSKIKELNKNIHTQTTPFAPRFLCWSCPAFIGSTSERTRPKKPDRPEAAYNLSLSIIPNTRCRNQSSLSQHASSVRPVRLPENLFHDLHLQME